MRLLDYVTNHLTGKSVVVDGRVSEGPKQIVEADFHPGGALKVRLLGDNLDVWTWANRCSLLDAPLAASPTPAPSLTTTPVPVDSTPEA